MCMWMHDYTADFGDVSLPPPHSPVLPNTADMLHATKRTLQMKHTCTKSISLLLRTLNILEMIVFLDALGASSGSMLRIPIGRRPLFLRP